MTRKFLPPLASFVQAAQAKAAPSEAETKAIAQIDQEGEGQRIGIAFGTSLCPIKALQAWLTAAGITEGPVFRSMDRHGNVRGRLRDRAVALVVKRYCAAAGMDERKYAGHSLRAGLVTQAAINQVPELTIMKTTRLARRGHAVPHDHARHQRQPGAAPLPDRRRRRLD